MLDTTLPSFNAFSDSTIFPHHPDAQGIVSIPILLFGSARVTL